MVQSKLEMQELLYNISRNSKGTSPCDQPCTNQLLHWPIAMINLWFTRQLHIFPVPVTSLTINMKCEQLNPTSWNKAVHCPGPGSGTWSLLHEGLAAVHRGWVL